MPIGLSRRAILLVFLAATSIAVAATVPAKADEYKMLGCSGAARDPFYTISTNTTSPQNPAGIFTFNNYCSGQGFDPPGNDAFLRIAENQDAGNANNGAYLSFNFDTPNQFIHFRTAGGYTREPGAFNTGWRSRLLISGGSAGPQELMSQGSGLCNCGDQWATTSTFAPHLWPYGGSYLDFTRFTFEMVCLHVGDCDRSGFNATDLNGMVFILSDEYPSAVNLIATDQPFLGGQWVRGSQTIAYNWTELGSGMKLEQVKVDGAVRDEINHNCATSSSQANGEYALTYQPCDTAADIKRYFPFETASLADGAHTVEVCTQDYAQWDSVGTGGRSCDSRTVHTDNTPPGAASGLFVSSSNPQRYMDDFNANFSLPPNNGSPITKVHYDVVNAAGEVVQPEKTVSGVDPTELKGIEGPSKPGDYRLRVWLEDQVGFAGPATSAPIPHDTVAPASPQLVSVAPPDASRSQQGFDVTWHNIVDNGSPIDEAHYQVLNPAGAVVVPTKTLSADNIQSIENLETPSDRGKFTLRLWLSDAEGNVGAPVSAPLSYECVRSPVAGGQQLTAGFGTGNQMTVRQGEGATVGGDLRGSGGDVAGAPLCVFSNPVTDAERDFLGMAVTGAHGEYRFAIPQGPSREISVLYRPNQRQLSATATLLTVVHPTFRAKKSTVENHHFAYFEGDIPGPHNNQVVIVLQVRSGKGWLAFRRYRTRNDGHFELAYKFNRTSRPTTYEMRAQVRQTTGYPYEQGNSDPLLLHVVPNAGGSEPSTNAKRHRCPKGKRAVKRTVKRGHTKTKKVVCVKIKKHHGHHGPGVRSTAASAVAASASRIAAPSRALDSART
jgi:hypothetical protein